MMTANDVQVYATFRLEQDVLYRYHTYIQWGESETSLGACLMLNPGSATVDPTLRQQLDTTGQATGHIGRLDDTMRQIIRIVEGIYEGKTLSGRFHLYNLFPMQHGNDVTSINRFEELCQETTFENQTLFASVEELRRHPFVITGWGVRRHLVRWEHLRQAKNEWMKRLEASGIPRFGIQHPRTDDFYHLCPNLVARRETIKEQIIARHREVMVPSRKRQWERILLYRMEGGRITLMGRKRSDDTWVFMRTTDETALLEEGDVSAKTSSEIVERWDDVVEHLLGEVVLSLRPSFVHPEFKERIAPYRRR